MADSKDKSPVFEHEDKAAGKMTSHVSILPGMASTTPKSVKAAKPKKKVGNIDKIIKPSRVVLRVTVERLKENNASAERAAWTIWGLLSSWNPNWAYNQEHLLSLKETEEGDVIESLTGLLKRKDVDVKLRALGALAQLPYLNLSIKATMAMTPLLMDRLVFFINREIGLEYNDLQLQIRGARVLSSICSTPFLSPATLEAIAAHPSLLETLVFVGSTGKAAAKHEVIRIAYNLSYGTAKVVAALERIGIIEQVLVPVLDGMETGNEVALRTLWAIFAIANLTEKKPDRQILKPEELLALVTAFRLAVQENTWEELDPAIQGTFGSVDISEAHDSALRIYPITAIVPLLRMSECTVKRKQLAKLGLGLLCVKFVGRFMSKRAEDIKAAQRKEETRLKLAAIQADAMAQQPKIAGQHVAKPAAGGDSNPSAPAASEIPWEELGLPRIGSEEDKLQVHTVTEALSLISNMAQHRRSLQEMLSAGVVGQVALLLSDRHAVIRRRACEVLRVLASSSSSAGGSAVSRAEQEKVMASLADRLRDAEETVWSVAAHALGALHEPGDPRMERMLLKCLRSKTLGVRRAAIAALGAIGERGVAGEGLVRAVASRMVEPHAGTLRVSAACALLEMAQGHGAEEVVAELSRRLEAFADRAGGAENSAKRMDAVDADGSAVDSVGKQAGGNAQIVAEMTEELSRELARRVSFVEGDDGGGMVSPAGSIVAEGDGEVDLEGVKLAVFVLGQIAPVQSRLALRSIARLLGRAELAPSVQESNLPPRSMANSSRLHALELRQETEMPLCTFQAVVNIAYVVAVAQADAEMIRQVRSYTADPSAVVRESACHALRELVLGGDKETVAALVELNYDADRRVVESAMRAIAQIVSGKQCKDGVLGSFRNIKRVAQGSRRVMSASRMERPLPQRPLVTREMLDRKKDLDGDGSHTFVYWSQAFRTGQISVIERTVEAKLATDRAGIPGWIYTLDILLADLAERDLLERGERRKEILAQQEEKLVKLHGKLLLDKEKTLAEKRVQLEKEMKKLEAKRPWFSHDDADFETEDQGFFGNKPTEEEMMLLKRKQEKEFTNRVAAIESFEFEVKQLEDLHNKILDTMSREMEHHIARTESEAEVRNDEEMDKQLAILETQQLKRLQQAKAGEYADMVSEVMRARAAEAEVFVACLSKEYLQDPVCRREALEAFHSGKRMIPLIVGTMPGMNDAPGRGLPLSGGRIWWPLRDEMGACFGAKEPIEMFQTVGPSTVDSTAFRQLFHRISEYCGEEMAILQGTMDQEWSVEYREASLIKRLQHSTRLTSKTEWMLLGKNG